MRSTIWFFLFGVVVLGSGCQSCRPGEASVASQAQDTLAYTLADHGKTVNARLGQSLSVSLEGNLSTGYSWSLVEKGTPVIAQTDGPVMVSKASDSVAVGVPEVTTWTFAARSTGETTLKLEYRRPWEQESSPAQTFELTIRVTE